VHTTLPQIPTRMEYGRITLRSYEESDASWYCAMSRRNRIHLARYEAENAVMAVETEQDARDLLRELNTEWRAGNCFFMGAFDRQSGKFVAQVYVGLANRDLPEFEIGFFADRDHEGQGYVSEAVRAVLPFLFESLGAHRVRMECDDTNERSRRVAERCGLVLEGHIRENRRNPDGTLSGTLHFGLLRNEFEPFRVDL
jgi:ribosomal-protein-alanine N-acetyltransferase